MPPDPITNPNLNRWVPDAETIIYSPPASGLWVMTVSGDRDGSMPSAASRRAAGYLLDRVMILKRMDRVEEIGPVVLATLPVLREQEPEHPTVIMLAEVVTLLMGRRDGPWEPPPGWAEGIPWYDPDHGDDGSVTWPGTMRPEEVTPRAGPAK